MSKRTVLTLDLEHPHVRDVVAVRTGELAVERHADLGVDPVRALHVSRLEVGLLRHQIGDGLRGAFRLDRRATSGDSQPDQANEQCHPNTDQSRSHHEP